MNRIDQIFEKLRTDNRAGLVTFITGGDPDQATSQKILNALPAAGADVIELGMPFSDPMADGPTIQDANLRALANGMTLSKILQMVTEFRKTNQATPLVLMGYLNPIESYGAEKFMDDAAASGVDGFILVDLPFEEDAPLRALADAKNMSIIRLATPTTDEKRLKTILQGSSGFLYYVSVRGITGQKSASAGSIEDALKFLKTHTDLPVALGFGIREPDQAADVARHADAVVVGSALVELCAGDDPVATVTAKVQALSAAIRAARL